MEANFRPNDNSLWGKNESTLIEMDFLRHKFMEWITKNKRATFGSTLRPFQSIELSLHWLLPSRANVRFTQQAEFNAISISLPTDTVYRTEPSTFLEPLKPGRFRSKTHSGAWKELQMKSQISDVLSLTGVQDEITSDGFQITSVVFQMISVTIAWHNCWI